MGSLVRTVTSITAFTVSGLQEENSRLEQFRVKNRVDAPVSMHPEIPNTHPHNASRLIPGLVPNAALHGRLRAGRVHALLRSNLHYRRDKE